MELSGTSFAAPVVAGAAAQILARHPEWTPDQVKGALMLTARHTPNAAPGSLGVGVIDAYAASRVSNPPNPNAAVNQFVRQASDGSGLVFDTASWANVAMADASWAQASWAQASWANASWAQASWAQASWANASWAQASWAQASWAQASWASASWATRLLGLRLLGERLVGLGGLRGQRRGRDERHRRGHRRRGARRARRPARRVAERHLEPRASARGSCLSYEWRAVPRTGEARDACGAYVSAMALRPHRASAWAKALTAQLDQNSGR